MLFNWDPTYIFIVGVDEMLLLKIDSKRFLTSHILIVFRLLFCHIAAQMLLVNIRTMCIVILTSGAALLNIQVILMEQRIGIRTFSLYKQLMIEGSVNSVFSCACLTSTLVGGLLLFALATAAVEIGYLRMNPILMTGGGLFVILIAVTIALGLRTCCSIHEKSKETLLKWRKQAEQRLDYRFCLRVLKSCTPLGIHVGNVGVVNKDLTINYFASTLVNTVNFLMAIKELMG